VAFTASLFLKKLPEIAQSVVCRAFTPPMFFWGALSLQFRLLISLLQFFNVENPQLVAFLRLCISVLMLFLVVKLRPYKSIYTFWLDVICYACLAAQFGLQVMATTLEHVGFDVRGRDEEDFFDRMEILGTVIRYAPSNISAVSAVHFCARYITFDPLQAFSHRSIHRRVVEISLHFEEYSKRDFHARCRYGAQSQAFLF
jgi:hypothetical protein